MDAAAEAFQEQKLIRHENLKWIIIAQSAVIVPLLLQLPLWLWLVWAGATFWRWQIYKGRQSFPSGITKAVLGLGCVGGLLVSYGGLVNMEPMVGFLVSAFILKLLEIRSRKDGLLMLFIGFIAVATQFLFAQTFLAAIYACFSCVLLITAWQTIYFTRSFTAPYKLKAGALLLLHALPLMVVMFVIMPRIGPLWRVPLPQGAGQTGFSDSLSPGDLGKLVKSQGTAFRASFTGESPPARDLYWRGLVLDHFDGRTWTLNDMWDYSRRTLPSNTVGEEGLAQGSLSEQTFAYEVIVEPHQHRWLFALAEPVSVDANHARITLTPEGLLATKMPVQSRMHYTVESVAPDDFAWQPLTPRERSRLVHLPPNANPQAKLLAGGWVLKNWTTEQKIKTALQRFNREFTYTLEPPVLGDHSVDEFLFTTRRGFCEHFASSFTFLMRAANVPARVVVGYQGGTFNEVENYWIVSQADAHAWAEVWIEGEGWRRVDPTSAVSPDRIELGISEALALGERQLVGAGQYNAPNWMVNIRHRLDAAGYVWNRWVLAYDSDSQNALLTRLLGGVDPWRVGLAFIAGASGLLLFYAWWVVGPRWRRLSSFQRALRRFDRRCKSFEVVREDNESIAAFSKRLAKEKPNLAAACSRLAVLSEKALYAADKRCEKALVRALARFPQV